MALPLKQNHRHSYTEYLGWPDDARCEIIDGVVYDMSPSPGMRHQTSLLALGSALVLRLEGHPCRTFIAPFDVVLSEFDVVQPDLLVVCDRGKITEKGIMGAPDVVIEFISPGSALKDRREKKNLYQSHGVREYILIYPIERHAEQFVLNDGRYGDPRLIGESESLSFHTLPGIEIPLAGIFRDLVE